MSKILIVDDSPAQLYSLRKIVEEGGHHTVTAESGDADRAWGLRQGAREYITKPVCAGELLAAISSAMAA